MGGDGCITRLTHAGMDPFEQEKSSTGTQCAILSRSAAAYDASLCVRWKGLSKILIIVEIVW